MSTLLLSPDDVEACVDMPAVIDAIEGAFAAHHRGESIMPPKVYIDLPQYDGDFRAMPAYVAESAGMKWVNVHPNNPSRFQLPTVMGVVIYNDPRNAYPLAIMDGTVLTRFRTGAVAAVASRHLAKSDASTLGLVGAGVQARTQLEAISAVVNLKVVLVNDQDSTRVEEFVKHFSGSSFDVREGSKQEVAGCDIVSTVTPSREPVLKREWIQPGTHINAIGADAKGKQELATEILLDSRVVVDDWEQCSHSGELNTAVAADLISREDIYGTLGEVVTAHIGGRNDDEVTVFDSTGLAIQDIVTARLVYERASELDRGTSFDLIADES